MSAIPWRPQPDGWPFLAADGAPTAFTRLLEQLDGVPEAEHADRLERAYLWAAGSAGEARRERARLLEELVQVGKAGNGETDALIEAANEAERRAQSWGELDDYVWAAMHYRVVMSRLRVQRGEDLEKQRRRGRRHPYKS